MLSVVLIALFGSNTWRAINAFAEAAAFELALTSMSLPLAVPTAPRSAAVVSVRAMLTAREPANERFELLESPIPDVEVAAKSDAAGARASTTTFGATKLASAVYAWFVNFASWTAMATPIRPSVDGSTFEASAVALERLRAELRILRSPVAVADASSAELPERNALLMP